MYKNPDDQQSIDDFMLPFEGKLKTDNRWVKMSKIILWNKIENDYAKLFPNNLGQEAIPPRMALGALITKEKLKLSDEEIVRQITESPCLQYFIGFKEYKQEQPFDLSLMVHFRKRFGLDNSKRNEDEGAFGETKRCYGLKLTMAKFQETSETVIALQFLVMNLDRRLRLLFSPFVTECAFNIPGFAFKGGLLLNAWYCLNSFKNGFC